MLVRFLRSWGSARKGETTELPEDMALTLLVDGVVKPVRKRRYTTARPQERAVKE